MSADAAKEKESPSAAGADDDLLAEWEAMAAEDEDPSQQAGQQNSARILNQDEIDSLIGFSDGDENADTSGIQSIINSTLVAYERLPMLEVVFDRLVRMLSTSLRNFTSDNVEVSLDTIHSIRFGDFLDSIPLPSMLGVMRAEEWDNYGLVVIDSALIYSIVDVLLGGRRGTAAMRVEGRPFTTIERSLIERMLHVVLNDLSMAFEPISPVSFKYNRLETNPRFATIARTANAIVVVKIRLDMEDRGGRMDIVIPYATLEPIREILLQMFMGEKFGRDSIWEDHLADALWRTDFGVKVVLDETTSSLGEIMNWKVGTTLPLSVQPQSDVELHCGKLRLFRGQMGTSHGKLALKIKERFTPDE